MTASTDRTTFRFEAMELGEGSLCVAARALFMFQHLLLIQSVTSFR